MTCICGRNTPCGACLHDGVGTPFDSLEAFVRRFLDPEDLGYAVTAEVRDAARVALGMPAVEGRADLAPAVNEALARRRFKP